MMNNYERIEIFLLYMLHCNIDLKSLQHQLQICKDKLNKQKFLNLTLIIFVR